MSLRVVLFSALACSCVPLLFATPVSAAPGQDATVVVTTFTISEVNQQGMATAMCPTGQVAVGGGAAPSAAPPFVVDEYRIYYSAPVDAAGTASTTDAGDVPRGWQVSVGVFGHAQTFKAFAICSATSDAVLAAVQPSLSGVITAIAPCPVGRRAIGGGMGKIDDSVIPPTTAGPLMYQTGPVDSSGTVAGTQDGDVATGWRTVAQSSAYGNRFFAVCSAASDAVVRSSSYTLPMMDNLAGGTAVSCPIGTRALSGGQANEGALDENDRLALMGPFGSQSELNSINTGAVGRAWSAYGQSSGTVARTNRVFVLCASDPPLPPVDATPPDTKMGKAPQKKTFSSKATFTFSSEAGATFTCQLDKKPAKACTSPYKVKKLKVGKHKLTVIAKDAAGNADPSPATFKWKVEKKPKRTPSGCTGECRSTAAG